ncbi:MAG: hypothetical protein M3401_13070 [Actinomycetota bacterium]|nr:hypothetical protein [Actinomycetota bacterium]
MISTPVTVALVVADIGLMALLLGGIAYAAAAERREAARPAGPAFALAGLFVAAWFVAVFILARNGAFASTSETTFPPLIGLAIIAPIMWGTVLLVALPGFLPRVARIPLHWLVGVQFYRVAGGLFLIGYLQDDLPAEFALPAGIGDVLVGLAAPFVARKLAKEGPQRARRAVLTWCTLGIFDLVVAVTCGFLSSPSVFQQLALDAPNYAITRYPFVLIPVFAVPASVLLHIYVIAQLVRRRAPAARQPARIRSA